MKPDAEKPLMLRRELAAVSRVFEGNETLRRIAVRSVLRRTKHHETERPLGRDNGDAIPPD